MIRPALVLLAMIASAQAQTLDGGGTADNKAAWDALVAAKCASDDRSFILPMGVFRFASPMAPIPCSLKVEGEGPGVTVFKLDYNSPGGAGYYVTGGLDPYGGGILRDASIVVTNGNTVGLGVWVQAHPETNPNTVSRNPHGFTLDNVIMGRDGITESGPFTGSFNYPIYLDGSLNVSPPSGVAPGIRYVRVRHVSVASFNILPALAYYAYGSRFIDFDCFASNGGPAEVEGLNDQSSTLVLSATCPYLHTGN